MSKWIHVYKDYVFRHQHIFGCQYPYIIQCQDLATIWFPHVIILACGMNSIPRDKYYIAAYMTIFTIGIAHSIIYVYREIDRVGNISDWTGDYIDIFNMTTGNSVIIDDLYSFKGLDMSFIYSFTLWSMIHHVIHACLVSVSIAIYFSVFIIIFSQKNGN